ncbi:MAG: metal ABC transporter permease [Planctomycetes bacterium]|nr:metal ABC transporter permease [Planctomycetota bacterium]
MNIINEILLASSSSLDSFWQALQQYQFLQYALLAGVLGSIACGIVGSYVVVRRITYIAGGIAHCVLGGIGAALYLQKVHNIHWLQPMLGAVAAALLAALIIGCVSLKAKQREDTVIGALWAVGMATGIMFISQTPGYNINPMSYLFGNILLVTSSDLWIIAILDVVVVTLCVLFYQQFLAVCFDEEYARTRGLNVDFYYLLLLTLTALTVVLLVSIVGIVLVIALLPLPVAVAGRFASRLWQLMILAALLTLLFTTAGLALSFKPNLPPGATIIILAGAAYLITTIAFTIKSRLKKS